LVTYTSELIKKYAGHRVEAGGGIWRLQGNVSQHEMGEVMLHACLSILILIYNDIV
jgi:hypothetical protein